MSGLLVQSFSVAVPAILLALLIGPVLLYLIGPWRDRRDEILCGFTDSAITTYLDVFFPGRPRASTEERATLERMYKGKFGRHRYVGSVVVLTVLAWFALVWSTQTLQVVLELRTRGPGVLPDVAFASLAGAYAWVTSDLIARCRSRDLAPADLWWSSLRFVIAAPLAYAVVGTLAPALSVPVAFLLGVFPTRILFTFGRRLVFERLPGLKGSDEEPARVLTKLQGVNTAIAERFEDEGVATIVQLAYADPIELTMRCSSYAFSFVIDCTSQALAWVYLEDHLPKLRVHSLRGAQEIASLVSDLDGASAGDPESASAARSARETLDDCATLLTLPSGVLEHTLRQIAEDPYTQFICDIWQVPDPDDSQASPVRTSVR